MSITELFDRARLGDWEAVRELHGLGGRSVLQLCLDASRESDSASRTAAAGVLGQLGGVGAESLYWNERRLALLSMLDRETDSEVLAFVIIALGHLGDASGKSRCLDFRNHPDASVREAVAIALMGLNSEESVSALLSLAKDSSPTTREWAAFSLGFAVQDDEASPATRLAARQGLIDALNDSDERVRDEALYALADAHDGYVFDEIQAMLRQPTERAIGLEAAIGFGDPSLLPLLTSLVDDSTLRPQDYLLLCFAIENSSREAPPSEIIRTLKKLLERASAALPETDCRNLALEIARVEKKFGGGG